MKKTLQTVMGVGMLMIALAVNGLAQGEFKGLGDGVETCPVTGEKITNKDVKEEFFGRTVNFCCAGCLAKAKASPAAYVKESYSAQVAAVSAMAKPEGHAGHGDHHGAAAQGDGKFLGKGDGVETCPVTGEPINKNVKAEIKGETVYFCCAGCIEPVKKNPELYLKKKETAFLGKGDGIETCPVMGTPVNKNLKAEINGKMVYFCCAGCVETVKKNPSAYLR
jgi:YHS domain-containing protein